MSPLRWLSMLCLVLCGWCAGDSVTAQIQVHLDTLRQTITLLELLRQEIGFRQSDLETLRKKLIAAGKIPADTERFQTMMPFVELTQEEKLCFSECFSGLGHTEAEMECRRLELYLDRFRHFQEESLAKAKIQKELSHKLGLAAGAAAAILLG